MIVISYAWYLYSNVLKTVYCLFGEIYGLCVYLIFGVLFSEFRVVFDYVDTLILNFAIEYFRQYDTVLAFFKGGQYSAFRKQREVVNLVALSV